MAYSFLKFKNLLSNKKVTYLPIRVSNEFTIESNLFKTAVFDTNFPNLSKKNSGTTLTLSLPRKSAFLKAPNMYYKKLQYQIIKKYKYQLIQKDENGNDYDSYIFEFAILSGWKTTNTILPGTDTPKYYEQDFRCEIVFRVLDTEHNDITNTVFLDTSVSPFAPENAYYPKGYYYLESLFARNYVPSYDVNEGTTDSDRCWANYNLRGFDDKISPINYYILFYYFENETHKYLTFCHGYDNDFYPGSLSYIYYVNAYASYNNSGVEYNLLGHAGLSYAAFNSTIELNYSPITDSDEDISSDSEQEDIKSTDDNSINYGNGIGEDTTEYIDFPSLTSENPATKSGIYRLVKMDVANLTKLSKFLWSTNPLDTLIKVFSKPFDCIISVQTLPYNVTADSSTSELKILDYSTGVSVYKNVYTTESLSFGTCECSESFGNFLDYDTTKVSIFLPYIGMQPLDVQDVMDAVLTLVYNVDNQTGQCVALLKCSKNNMDVDAVTYSWSGNLSNQLPLTGADNTQYLQGLFNSISSVAIGSVGGLSTQSRKVAIGSSGKMITDSLYPIFNGNKEIIKSGRLDSNTGILSIQYPFIKIERPVWSRPDNYLDVIGQPYFADDTLGNLSGFVKVKEVKSELNGVPAESRDRIIELLKDGVYI